MITVKHSDPHYEVFDTWIWNTYHNHGYHELLMIKVLDYYGIIYNDLDRSFSFPDELYTAILLGFHYE